MNKQHIKYSNFYAVLTHFSLFLIKNKPKIIIIHIILVTFKIM